jgi:hypothetical protein
LFLTTFPYSRLSVSCTVSLTPIADFEWQSVRRYPYRTANLSAKLDGRVQSPLTNSVIISDMLPVIDTTAREKCQASKIPQPALLCHIRWWCKMKSLRKDHLSYLFITTSVCTTPRI